MFQGEANKIMLALSGKSSSVDTDLTLDFIYDHDVVGADINGDGITDALIAYARPPGTNDGVYVVFGAADLGTSAVTHDVRIESTSISFADVLGRAGDVNGDGIDDVIIGNSQGEPYRGLAYVLYGGDGFATPFAGDKASDQAVLDALGVRGFRVVGDSHGPEQGNEVYSELGASVAGGGDFNGDGLDDVVLGAPKNSFNDRSNASTTHENHGAAYVVFGSATQADLDATRGRYYAGGFA